MSRFRETERLRRIELQAHASELLRGCPWAEKLRDEVVARVERGDKSEDIVSWIEAKTQEYHTVARETIRIYGQSKRVAT